MDNTKDIWVRDFMPLQLNSDTFLGYVYCPDYLKKDAPHRTDDIRSCYDFQHVHLRTTDVIIDGGNLIKTDNKIIMTDKVFCENTSVPRAELWHQLEDYFGCEIIIIPWDRDERFGHADGMVRFVAPGHILLNHYVDYNPKLRVKLLKILSPHFDTISELTYGTNARMNSWAHLNFLRVGDVLFVPQVNIASDEMALSQLQTIYKDCKIVPVLADGFIRLGGALNCVSWNIKEL